MIVKCTMLMQIATNASSPTAIPKRIGGWSESYYFEAPTLTETIVNFNGGGAGPSIGLCGYRAQLLPDSGAIVGQRFQVVDPSGPSQSTNKLFPGNRNYPTDVPQMALLCRAPGVGVQNIRSLILRGIPDQMVVEGEYQPNQGYALALGRFLTNLQFFKFRGKNFGTPSQRVWHVEGDGKVHFVNPQIGMAVGLIVEISAPRLIGGGRVSGRFQIVSVGPDPRDIVVSGWPVGVFAGEGSIRGSSYIYAFIDSNNITIGRIIVRKVGRPFIQYRGRRSNRF